MVRAGGLLFVSPPVAPSLRLSPTADGPEQPRLPRGVPVREGGQAVVVAARRGLSLGLSAAPGGRLRNR